MKKQLIILLLCLLTALAAYQFTPNTLLADASPITLESIVPTAISGWHQEQESKDAIITSPELEEKISSIYSQTLSRRYLSDDGYRIMLSIAYTKDQRDNAGQQSHRPEICYPAQGFEILRRSKSIIDERNIPLIRLETVNQERYEVVSYFMTIGNLVANTSADIKFAQIKYSLDGYIPDGVIFRVSSIDTDSKRAFAEQNKFILDLLTAAPSAASRILPIHKNESL